MTGPFLMRFAGAFLLLSLPSVALAASGQSDAATIWAHLASIAINTYIASRIAPLEKRVSVLEAKR